MYSGWTRHLNEDEKKRFISHLLGSREILEKLQNLIAEEMSTVSRVEMAPESYDNPNWSHKQAYYNGFYAACVKILRMLNIDEERN